VSKVFPLQGNQKPAVDPERTVWLSASAGTGKTQVLSARVLRLLLQPGVRPEQLLCLTFTKAGAAEMAMRVNEVLARWVRLPDVHLAIDLQHIAADFDPAAIKRARSLFAAVLDCPGGGLRIETIHAFSQWLLSAFPVEAGLTPGTRAMEDRDRDLLLRQVLADMLLEAQERGDERLLDALANLSLRLTSEQIERFLLRCAGARDLWLGDGAWQPPLRPRIERLLGLPAEDEGGTGVLESLCRDDVFDCASVRRCMEMNAAWGTKTGLDSASILGDWLASTPGGRIAGFEDFALQFLTKTGVPRSTTNIEKKFPDYAEYASRVIACLEAVAERKALIALADVFEPALDLGRRFALAWDAAKAREGYVDFDDLIRMTAGLLSDQGIGEWVRYKLDRSFDHILVDEAQDTNAAQWDIIDALVADFFTGEGQRGDALRTLFVVGDYKQAIFRFQGTSPENFEAARKRVEGQLRLLSDVLNDESRALLDLGLGQSYRTALPVLNFVDRAITHIGSERFGLLRPPEPHHGENRPGLVALWQPVGLSVEEAAEDAEDEPADEGEEGWLSRPDRKLADTLARQIRAWMETGFPLVKGKARVATPGDIMILVRKRKELAGLIVARLHAQGVPVAGVDRLRLGAPLAVKDLVAALRFAAQPLDDLNLANLLVSPLIGFTQQDLLDHAYRKDGVHLWEHLRAAEGPATTAAMQRLRDLLARADYQTPQALLHWLLVGPWQGRRALVARLGHEANDPIDELLNAAMAYASTGTPSLVGFLQWFDAGEGELKREAGKAENLVRVMTVHGAKGLQAPIVILADAADDPDKSPPRAGELVEDVFGRQRKVPLPPLRKAEKAAPVAAAEAKAAAEEREEHWRLLYVAMTRAEEALFVAGALRKDKQDLPPESWYAQLEPLFPPESTVPDELWGSRREFGSLAPRPASPAAPPELPQAPLPGWLSTPIGPEPRPPRPLAPSSLGEDEAPDPPFALGPGAVAAARRGTLIHKLIERLPELPAGQRGRAADNWLAAAANDLPASEREAIRESALAVLSHPDWAEVFGPGSLAEVPLAAVVGGRVIAGTVDRLVFAGDTIRIIDFKSSRRPPQALAEIPAAYLRQMAAYAAALRTIHPGSRIEAALLYTQTPVLFALPDDLLAAQKLDWETKQESFAG
jgi:ATP-dependent helicase/nuclease subunit A